MPVEDSGLPIKSLLLVEDNPADVYLLREALEENRVAEKLQVARDGCEAMDFLHRRGEYVDMRRPDLILLDLNLPRKDGREVLAEIKSDPELKKIPVIVLTTSSSEEDILKSYKLHANCFISKPRGIDDLFRVVTKIVDFWLRIVNLPPREEHE